MKKTGTAARMGSGQGTRLAARTGSHCPVNGFWRAQPGPAGGVGEPLFVFEGSIMPTSSGRGTTWYLVDTRSPLAD
ncbi:hypothetical protein FCN77_01470 [Arthrobacter sp. 24S4-2]|jgi:hypothetical protein|uniref:hypothetical protein n=1 Tax=Arthrobacter sp. 24S4-2 TaxID=2575374 RepID=UPI0010C7A950|nr:hypothetical protein [Arthrobacter sp. 24S4-2]QCO96626.1 hypothetical protein FCN77_01470 [Arthrobacter sp. 24S4-2]